MWRAALLEAGATDGDLEALASWLVGHVVEARPDDREGRRYQFELIARHFVVADMTVRVTEDGHVCAVDFPSRPTVQ